MDFRLGNASRPFEVVEVAALVRLPGVLDEHPVVTPRVVFQLPTFSGGVRTDCVVGIERDFLSGIKSLTGEVAHGRDDRPLVGARARRMRVRGPAFGPALAQTHRAYGGRDRG